jgi:uncharacterized delta-60 repeat protein
MVCGALDPSVRALARALGGSWRICFRLAGSGLLGGLVAGPLAAQAAGDLDPAFGVGGQQMIDFDHSTDLAEGVAQQADGKLVVVGTSYAGNNYSTEDFAVARLLPDGSLDATFGAGGLVTTDFPGLAAVASSVLVQPDGKIVVAGGAFPQFTFLGDFKLVRYEEDGSLDASFGVGGIVTTAFPGQGSYAFDVVLQADGKIIAAGTDYVDFSSSQSSNTDFALARYHADGSLDTTFGSGGRVVTDFDGFNDDAFSVLVQPDGKVIAVGSALSQAKYYDFAAARYSANGVLDASYGVGGKVRTDFGANDFDRAHSAVLQPDGKLVAAGFTVFDGGLSQPFALARYRPNGLLDPTFDADGKLLIDFGSFLQSAHDILLQGDGKLVPVGYADTESSDSDFLLARCNSDGTLDTSFGTGGKVRTSFGNLNGGAKAAVLQSDGKIVAAGFQATFSNVWSEFALARYLGDPWIGYCTAGTSASGCQAALSAAGTASSTAPSGFSLDAQGVEGAKDGLFYFGANGRQANPWGNGTSFQCVVPPVSRAPLMNGAGTVGACDGSFSLDLNALWCPSCPKPAKNPGAGALVQAQLWYRDPQSTSNQTTSLSDAVEFPVAP